MGKFEQSKRRQTRDDKGSYEFNEAGEIVRNPEISDDKFLVNEADYRKSKYRMESLKVMTHQWWDELNMEDVFDREEMNMIFSAPDNFIASLEYYEANLSVRNYVDYLDQVSNAIQNKLEILEDKRKLAVDYRLDSKPPENKEKINMLKNISDNSLKDISERIIEAIDSFIANGNKVLVFIAKSRKEIKM